MLAFALCLVLAGAQELPAPVARVPSGEALLGRAGEARSLDRRSGSVALAPDAHLECRPRTRLELTWRGAASAVVDGPAELELVPGSGLVLQRYATAEIEVRRGHLALELPGLGTLELGAGAAQVRALPDGLVDLFNRGGTALELRRNGEPPQRIAPGTHVRLRAR